MQRLKMTLLDIYVRLSKVHWDSLTEILLYSSRDEFIQSLMCPKATKNKQSSLWENPLLIVLTNFCGVNILTNSWFQTSSALPTNSQNSPWFNNWSLETNVNHFKHTTAFNPYSWIIFVIDVALSIFLVSSILCPSFVAFLGIKFKFNKFSIFNKIKIDSK